MKAATINKNTITTFLADNWLKILIIGFISYMLFQKDMSFTINFSSPFKNEAEKEEKHRSPAVEPVSQQKKEREQYSQQTKGSNSGIDRFTSPIFGGSSNAKSPLDALQAVSETSKMEYLQRFAHVAISERKKYGVPSSIILANALLHSYGGQCDMTKNGNNHFGIPCTNTWDGASSTYNNTCYRHYDNAWSSFRDHSQYVTNGRYESLRNIEQTNYQAWAQGLEDAGYSTMPNYAKTLLQLIEKYQLYELDKK